LKEQETAKKGGKKKKKEDAVQRNNINKTLQQYKIFILVLLCP